jgi:hypothetical protein
MQPHWHGDDFAMIVKDSFTIENLWHESVIKAMSSKTVKIDSKSSRISHIAQYCHSIIAYLIIAACCRLYV